jgi:uncharacterized membrane protein YcaP (DUF421 family)
MAIGALHYKCVAAETCACGGVTRDRSKGEQAIFFVGPTVDALARGAIFAALALLWVVLLVRVVGLRSFSKMTSFDFVMTIAMGSLVGSAARVSEWDDYFQALAAMAALFVVQWASALVRKASKTADRILQNQPILLMRDGRIIDEALKQTRVSRDNLYAKLREANVLDPAQVRAVVLETTGDVSVLYGEKLEEVLLEGVERADA